MITVKFLTEIHASFGDFLKNDIANIITEQYEIVKQYVEVL